jgi:Zn-dependent protease/CBS domain-containing protein
MKSSLRLFRIAGIDIGIHYTWIFIFVLITWSLAAGVFPAQHPHQSTAVYWTMGVITALLLFVSVLLHELAHSLVAKSRGMQVSSITLFILGGVSNLEEEPEKPGIEFSMAIVGPLTSLIIGIICWGIVSGMTGALVTPVQLFNGSVFNTPLEVVIGYLAWINVLLAAFNLLPGFPLDGGRVLRSILWGSTGSLIKATNIAGRIGQVFGWALIGFGVYELLSGNFIGGLWIAFIGWFLMSAADSSRKEITLRERLSHIKVRDVVRVEPQTIPPETTVSDLVNHIFSQQHGRAIPVCRDGRLRGIVTVTDVKKVPQDRWSTTTVESIMTSAPLYTVNPDDNLNMVMKLISQHDINQVLVNRDGQCAGMLSRADIIHHIQFSQEMGLSGRS